MHNQKFKKRLLLATFLGNILEHYDKVLYGLVAPFIAPLFFPNFHPLTRLILVYFPLGLLFRPLGALFFGKMGDAFGHTKALFISIVGMSTTMLLIGLLPSFQFLGLLSPLLLCLLRAFICFFAAGETTGAPLVLIENSPRNQKDLMSSFYEMSSMVGVMIASSLITYLCFIHRIEAFWRILFILSGCVGLVGAYARKKTFIEPIISQSMQKINLREQWMPFLAIVFLTGFSCANYNILMHLMNAYLPLFCKITRAQVMGTHTFLVLLDFLLLPCFGWLSKKIGKEKLIFLALLTALVSVFPLFNLLKNPHLFNILFVRFMLVTWGIAIAAPFQFWAIDLIPKTSRFRTIALAKSIGAQWIGGPAISLSLILYKRTSWISSPALYIFVCALFSIVVIYLMTKSKVFIKNLL